MEWGRVKGGREGRGGWAVTICYIYMMYSKACPPFPGLLLWLRAHQCDTEMVNKKAKICWDKEADYTVTMKNNTKVECVSLPLTLIAWITMNLKTEARTECTITGLSGLLEDKLGAHLLNKKSSRALISLPITNQAHTLFLRFRDNHRRPGSTEGCRRDSLSKSIVWPEEIGPNWSSVY